MAAALTVAGTVGFVAFLLYRQVLAARWQRWLRTRREDRLWRL